MVDRFVALYTFSSFIYLRSRISLSWYIYVKAFIKSECFVISEHHHHHHHKDDKKAKKSKGKKKNKTPGQRLVSPLPSDSDDSEHLMIKDVDSIKVPAAYHIVL